VRCVYNFPAETDNDLDLHIGDVVRVTRVINADWYEGQVHNRRGQFPAAYVEDCNDVFDLAVADRAFAGEQEGDLSFQPGEYIVVTEIVDENWMRGYVQGGGYGLFPRSFVKEISLDPSEISSVIGGNSVEKESNDSSGVVSEAVNEDGASTKGETVEVEPAELWVDVLENFNAMDSTELNLVAGTKVKIVCDVDDFWCKGITPSGEEGIFPRNFVDLPELDNKSEDVQNTNSIDEVATPQPKEDVPVVEVIQETKSKSDEPKPIGKVEALFNFTGPEKGDLSFNQGNEILLLENINKEWMKGMVNDGVGIFPSSYVKVLEMFPIPSNDIVEVEKTESTISTTSTNSQSSTNLKKSSPRAVSPSIVEPKKPPPPKPSKPQRPKLPDSKKFSDDINPFLVDLKLKSKPLVIIPAKYRKQGSTNIIILKNWKKEELDELKHNRES